MGRGKYTNRAEAAQARESAIVRANRLQRENDQLLRRIESETEDHRRELALAREQAVEARERAELIEAGELVTDLLATIGDLADDVEAANYEAGLKVARFAKASKIEFTPAGWEALGRMLGLSASEMMSVADDKRRRVRRLTYEKLHRWAAEDDARTGTNVVGRVLAMRPELRVMPEPKP
jgi:hypothetical protein